LKSICYIAGIGRSGSTILDLLLSQSDELCGTGQVAALHRELTGLCSCGMALSECPYWGAAIDQLGETGLNRWRRVHELIFRERHVLRFVFSSGLCQELSEISDEVYELLFTRSNAKVLVDSSKNVSRAIALARSTTHRFRVLHLIRDSRGYMNSVNSYRRDRDQTPIYFRSFAEWLFKNTLTSLVLRRYVRTEDFLRIRFEELMSRPVETLTRIGEWLDVDVDQCLDAAEGAKPLKPGHVFSGNRLLRGDVIRFERKGSESTELIGRNDRLFWYTYGWLSRFWGYRR